MFIDFNELLSGINMIVFFGLMGFLFYVGCSVTKNVLIGMNKGLYKGYKVLTAMLGLSCAFFMMTGSVGVIIYYVMSIAIGGVTW